MDKEAIVKCVKSLIDVMEIQEKRETGEFHIGFWAFNPMWEEAKENGRKIVEALEGNKNE
jgi:hypothetical protein